MKGLLVFSSAIDRVNAFIGRVMRWLTLAMVVVGSANAVFRYAGRFTGVDLSSNAYLESQWYLFSLVFLLAASYTLSSDSHVRVDVLFGRLSDKGRAWINLAGGILFLIPFCILMIWVSWPWVMNSFEVMEMSPDPGGLPRYPLKMVIPVTFVLLMAQGFSEVIKSLSQILGNPPAPTSLETASRPPEGVTARPPAKPRPNQSYGG
jgi:TRAP-type mannitol/chloroaromatic compound transport system permease small subunit